MIIMEKVYQMRGKYGYSTYEGIFLCRKIFNIYNDRKAMKNKIKRFRYSSRDEDYVNKNFIYSVLGDVTNRKEVEK